MARHFYSKQMRLGPNSGGWGTINVSGLLDDDSIKEAVDKIETIIDLLAPSKPANLSDITLSAGGTFYSGKVTGDPIGNPNDVFRIYPETVTEIVFTADDSGDVIYDATAGTLSFEVLNPEYAGETNPTITFTTGDDTNLTYQDSTGIIAVSLRITEDEDYHLGSPGQSGFWFGFKSQGRVNVSTVQASTGNEFILGNTYNVRMSHTETGNTDLDFHLEEITQPTGTLSAVVPNVGTASNIKVLNGVPGFSTTAEFIATYTAENIAKQFYKNNNTVLSQSKLQNQTISNNNDVTVGTDVNMGITDPYNDGSNLIFDLNIEDVINQSSASPIQFSLSNSYWDHDVESPNRIWSGTTDLQDTITSPTVFENSDRDDDNLGTNVWDAFVAARELQRRNGKYKYPNIDYSTLTPAGPNYSTLTGNRYLTINTGFNVPTTDQFTLNTPDFTGILAADFGATNNTGAVGTTTSQTVKILIYVDSTANGGWYDATLDSSVFNNDLSIQGCLTGVGGATISTSRRIQLSGVTTPGEGRVYVRYMFADTVTSVVGEPTATT